MDTVKTKRRIVFDFDQAVKQGMARDQDMNKHMIQAHGDKFLITTCDGKEHCFNRDGKEFDDSPKVKLVEPQRVRVELLPFLIYDSVAMTILDQADWVMDAMAREVACGNPNAKAMNVTHPANQDKLRELGIIKRYWYEEA